MLGSRREIFAVDTAREHSNLRVRNTRWTTGGANSAHYAVKRFLRALFKLSALCVCDVLHNVQLLRTSFGAGVTADTSVYLGVELHHNLLGYGDFFYIVNLFYKREEGKSCDKHIIFYFCLAGEAGFKLLVAFDTIYSGTSAAEAVSTTATAYQLISRIFHRAHYGEVGRNAVTLAKQINVNHIFHYGVVSLISFVLSVIWNLIFLGKLVKLVKTEHGAVLADIEITYVAASALADTAFHSHFKSGVYLILFKAELLKSC